MATSSYYLTPTFAHRGLGLVCLGAGAQDGIYAGIEDRTLESYAVVLVSWGEGVLEWDTPRTRLEFNAPLLFFLQPGLVHSYRSGPRGWSQRWALFDGPALRAYHAIGYLPPHPPTVALRDAIPVSRVFDRLIHACRPDQPYADVEAAALVHELLVTIHRYQAAAPLRRSEAAIVSSLRDRAASAATVAEHARQLGLSPKTLRGTLQVAEGCNPKAFLVRTRLNKAKKLLAETEEPVSQIARMVGYDDPAYFSRVFTRRVGLSPRRFRHQEQLRSGPE